MSDELLQKLNEYKSICEREYRALFRKLRLLEAIDKGKLWEALKAQFPDYQILPDTNFINYLKKNLVASLYTVTKSAQIQPTSENDMQLCLDINLLLEKEWSKNKIGKMQLDAGENAALHNLGITQVGYDASKDDLVVRNVSPLKFMRDPYATSLETAGYCMTYENLHKSIFNKNPLYKDEFEKYLAKNKEGQILPNTSDKDANNKDYYTLYIIWVRESDGIYEYHTVNVEHILHKKGPITPDRYPFALLYCNNPMESPVGVSEPMLALANSIAYNLMDSISLTSEYANQRPPKFINRQSMLNVQEFAKYGDQADKTFIVNGDASKAVHYHQFPMASNQVPYIKQSLSMGIQQVSGIDGRYTGRDTGSIITTGGTEEMLNRVTLIDTPKIMLYEDYAKDLTQLILGNLIEYAPKRTYYYRKPNTKVWKNIEVDFPKVPKDIVFEYELTISSELPKNKARIDAMADVLMEKQMQYGQGQPVQLITPEEWLFFKDIPNKEMFVERMGLERDRDYVQQVTQAIYTYADLVKNGLSPDEAILATASTMQSQAQGMPIEDNPNMNLMANNQI